MRLRQHNSGARFFDRNPMHLPFVCSGARRLHPVNVNNPHSLHTRHLATSIPFPSILSELPVPNQPSSSSIPRLTSSRYKRLSNHGSRIENHHLETEVNLTPRYPKTTHRPGTPGKNRLDADATRHRKAEKEEYQADPSSPSIDATNHLSNTKNRPVSNPTGRSNA